VSAAPRRRGWEASLRSLLVFAAVLSSALFLWRGYALPLANAFANAESHYDLHGRYFGALDLLQGSDPYSPAADAPSRAVAAAEGVLRTPSTYAPIVLLLYAPLTLVGFTLSKAIWLTVQLALLVLVSLLLVRLASPRPSRAWVAAIVLMVTCSEVAIRNLSVGQHNTPILLLLALGVLCLQRGREEWAAALFASAAVYKPIPALLLGRFLLRRRWRSIGIALAVPAGFAFASIVLFGLWVHVGYLREVAGTAIRQVPNLWWAYQGLTGLFGRLLLENRYSTPWVVLPSLIPWLLSLAASGALALAAVWATQRWPEAPAATNVSLWLVTGLLVSPKSLDTYVLWALIPLVVVLREAVARRDRVLLALFVLGYALTMYPSMYWGTVPSTSQRPIAVAHRVSGVGLAVAVWRAGPPARLVR
jgi:hypothetical protein